MRGAVVLAGGPSRRLTQPKALILLGGRSLLRWVVGAASSVADEVVVVSRGALAAEIETSLGNAVRVVRDRRRLQTPLVGLWTGADTLDSEYVAALACDVPFVEPEVLDLLFAESGSHEAAIPRWPNGEIEPLVAVYRRSALAAACQASLASGERANQDMVRRLGDVRFVPVDALRSVDRSLRSFVNVNTPEDLADARRLMRFMS